MTKATKEKTQKAYRFVPEVVAAIEHMAKSEFSNEVGMLSRLIVDEYKARLKDGRIEPLRGVRVQYRVGYQGHVVHNSEWFHWHVNHEGQLTWGKWPDAEHQRRSDDPGVSKMDVEAWTDPAGDNWPPPDHAAHRDDISARRAAYIKERGLVLRGVDPKTGDKLYDIGVNAPREPLTPMDVEAFEAELNKALGE